MPAWLALVLLGALTIGYCVAWVIVDRFMSVSFIAALPADEQARVRAQIEALIASHPALRGREVLRFPYQTRAFWFARH